MNQAKKYTLPQEALKLIACVTMLIDHIGAVFIPQNPLLRIIGRISFPIYCFLLAEGIHHTKKPQKYGLRLLLLAVLSEIPFDLLFYGRLTWAHQSVMVTLLLAFLMGMCMKKVQSSVRIAAALLFALAAELLSTDYGGLGVLTVALFLLTRELPHRTLVQFLGLVLLNWLLGNGALTIQMFAILAALPIILYSGQKAIRGKALQWSVNLFYPVHLLVLLLLKIF